MRVNPGILGWPGAGDAFARRLKTILGLSTNGLVVGSPTGGDKGVGAVNAQEIYRQGVAIPVTKSFVSTDQTITIGGALNIPHGLGVFPPIVVVYLVCEATDIGYSAGQLVQTSGASSNSTTAQITIAPDATNVNIRFPSAAVVIGNYGTGASAAIDVTKWKLRIYAYV